MKVRSDFITNSSSSSFVIIFKKEDKDIADALCNATDCLNTTTGSIISKKRFLEEYPNATKIDIADDAVIVGKSIDDSADSLVDFLCELEKSKRITVLGEDDLY